MTFQPPSTLDQLDEIIAVIAITDFTPHNMQRIGNVYATHVDPRKPFCASCGDAQTDQRMISVLASQRLNQWRADIAAQAVNEFKNPNGKDPK